VKSAWVSVAVVALAPLVGCGGGAAVGPAASVPESAPESAPASSATVPPLPIAPQPDVELRDAHAAFVRGQSVPFDGVEEGLVWPALAKAVGPRKAGDVVTIQVSRGVPVVDLARAAWTVHQADVRVQSADADGTLHVVELRARRDGAPPVAGCHLAVFLRADGTLRVAAPGGPREVGGERPAASLARSLEDERARCPIKYVAFGAESDAAPWGPVFDVIVAVDRAKSAGDARYVLGQAMR
jgi:hypothetical protein